MKYKITGMCWFLVVCLLHGATMLAQESPTYQLQKLFADAWEFNLQENPLFATSLGDYRFNDQLPKVSLADAARRYRKNKEFLQRLAQIDRNQLPAADRINYDIFKILKEQSIRGFELQDHLFPITNRAGFHISFPELPDRLPFKTVRHYEDYIARLNGFKAYAAGHIELMREGIRQGYVLPRIVLQGIEDTITPHIVDDPEESLLFASLEKQPATISAAEQKRLAEAARRAIMQSVVPGYRDFLAFIRDEYIPAAREDIGASTLPDGKALYQFYVRKYTTLDLTPEQIHEIGLAEVKRLRAEMKKIIDRVGFQGTFREFIEFLRTDARFYVDTPDALLKEVAYVLKRMDGQLPRLFGRLPRMSYGIRPVPDYIAPKTTTAYYSQPSGDGTRAGFYYVNTYDLRSRPLYEIEALSFHEAVPGHHLQLALQQELENLPNFRRFSGFTAFVEGWALYSERLGLEVGFYTDPYSDFGRLTYEMWRACRLVVDTGMHALGWTRQQAIDFMAENTALTLLNITNEVDRYISWPGQALAYKMGELKITQLRRRAQAALGEKFDLRAFHDVVLGSGSVPLELLERKVMEWIEGVQSDD